MFDPQKARDRHEYEYDKSTDDFAELLEDLETRKRRRFIEKACEVLSDASATQSFIEGDSSSTNGTAGALGPGNTSSGGQMVTDDERKFLDRVNAAGQGQQRAILRVLEGSIEVDNDGTPVAVGKAERERDEVRQERDDARQELKDEQNPRKDGSLAKKLATVTQERDAARDGSLSQDARERFIEVIDATKALKSSRTSNKVEGKETLNDRLGALGDALGVPRRSRG